MYGIIDYGGICSSNFPVLRLDVRLNSPTAWPEESYYYYDLYSLPVLLEEDEYEAGDVLYISVFYDWNGSPGNDYTLKIYS